MKSIARSIGLFGELHNQKINKLRKFINIDDVRNE